MLATATKQVFREAIALAIPDRSLNVPKWAEARRVVDRGARKGRWSNDTVPFATEIMAEFTNPAIREIVFQKSTQVAGSEIIMNMVGWAIEMNPTEMAYVAEKEDKAKAWTVESFDATVRTTDSLKRLVYTSDEDNNQRVKRFAGGMLVIVWATSPAELSSRPLQYLFFDEKAAYKPTNEGDPVKLGEMRTDTYFGEEKIVKVSSPRFSDHDSDIEKDYLRGDQREYYVPCFSCGEFQTLQWANVKWDKDDPDSAYMVCLHCGVVIEEADKHDMLLAGEWRKSQITQKVASFKINRLYSPFVPWSKVVEDFIDSQGSITAMQVWTNTSMGEPWRPSESVEYAQISFRSEDYGSQVPAGVLFLTAAADIQGDRIEFELVGWGMRHESWSIRYEILEGDPNRDAVWDELYDLLDREYISETGDIMQIRTACIDSGYLQQRVFQFCKANSGRRWFPVKGQGGPFVPLIAKATLQGRNPKMRVFPVGTNAAKDEMFGALSLTEPGPGFCHFPKLPNYDDAYFKQLCAEKRVPHMRMGQKYFVYEKVGANVRNEAIDLRVYNIAARAITNPNYARLAANREKRLAGYEPTEPIAENSTSNEVEKQATPKKNPHGFRVINNPFEGYRP